MYRDRHLGTIRSNIDKGWKPSTYTNNYQISFDDYKFNERGWGRMTFLSYRGTMGSHLTILVLIHINRRQQHAQRFLRPTEELQALEKPWECLSMPKKLNKALKWTNIFSEITKNSRIF